MALKGTLTDFGIADILQLIGQQRKTGVLYVRGQREIVDITFVGGEVMRAIAKGRASADMLGGLLINAGMISQTQLDQALETQKRTLRRLGDILVENGAITSSALQDMSQMQTAETIYEMFHWVNGSYEFIQQDIEFDPNMGSFLQTESIAIEGFRRVDEWPALLRKIPDLSCTFERQRPLEGVSTTGVLDTELDLALKATLPNASDKGIGPLELLVYRIAEPTVSAKKIAARTRKGDFETSKALVNLIDAGYLAVLESASDAKQPLFVGQVSKIKTIAYSLSVLLLTVVVLIGCSLFFDTSVNSVGTQHFVSFNGFAEASFVARQQRIVRALNVYLLMNGHYPDSLNALVTSNILPENAIAYTKDKPYLYQLEGAGYILFSPVL